MTKSRKEYAYVATRIDPEHSQNLGDFMISYRGETNVRKSKVKSFTPWDVRKTFHYASEDYSGRGGEIFRRGRIINRGTLRELEHNSRTYSECIKAVERLLEEESK